MIKETRIGNFIYDEDNLISRICGYSPFGHSVRCDEEEGCEILVDIYNDEENRWVYGYYTEKIKGIKLTGEWLVRFGFVYKEDEPRSYYELEGNRVYLLDNNEFDFELKLTDEMRVNLFRTYKYVHELQNLYYSITHQELNTEFYVNR